MINKRLTNSIDCLEMLKDFFIAHPEIRLEQLLNFLDDKEKDYFYEEPWETKERWERGLNELEEAE